MVIDINKLIVNSDIPHTKKNESSLGTVDVVFNPSNTHAGNKDIGFNYEKDNINKNINIEKSIPKTPQECDYYFETREDFDNRRDQILAENNNDLSQKTFGFGDGATDLTDAFKGTLITSTPKMIFSRNVTSLGGCFYGCKSLTSILQGLFDNCLKVSDFSYCFSLCESLTSIPNGLFDKNVNVTNFSECFQYCRSLTTIPQGLFDKNISATSFYDCFRYCPITSIPDGLFNNCPKVTNFTGCFEGCYNITSIPQRLFDNCFNVISFYNCFRYCSITSIPGGLFDNCVNVEDFSNCFENCKSLTSISSGLFDKCSKVTNFTYCFSGCTLLTTVPFNLFDNCTKVSNFSYCFYKCSEITSTLPDAWNKEKFPNVTGGSRYTRRYAYNCIKAINYNEIPDEFKF